MYSLSAACWTVEKHLKVGGEAFELSVNNMAIFINKYLLILF